MILQQINSESRAFYRRTQTFFASLLFVAAFAAAVAAQPVGQIKQPLTADGGTIWSSSQIPVCWDTWNAAEAMGRAWVQNAVSETWEKSSLARFVGWGNCATTPNRGAAIRIRVADEHPRVTALGSELRGKAGGMVLNFTYEIWSKKACGDNREFCTRAIAAHEFGHALGFTHEDHRSERHGCGANHTAQGSAGDFKITSYDLLSIMNYCNPAWNGDGKLSFHDKWGAVSVYGGWSPDFPITPNNAAGGFSNLAVAHRNSDELHIFYQTADRAVGTNWVHTKHTAGKWKPNPIGITPPNAARADTPLAAVARGDQVHVFYQGNDGAIATTWASTGGWANPFPITPPGAARADSPLVAALHGDYLHVYYIGKDGAIGSTFVAPNVNGGRWVTPFGVTPPNASGANSNLDVAVRGNQIHLFYQGADGALATTWASSGGGAWANPFPITPPNAGERGTKIDAVTRADQIHVFYQGGDRALATIWAAPNANGGRWANPFPITPPNAGRANSPVAAIARGTNKFDVNFIGADGAVATVWANAQIQNGRWQTPYPVTPPGFARSNSVLTGTTRYSQTMDVFYLGQRGEIKTLWSQEAR